MTTCTRPKSETLTRLLALVCDALELSDSQDLHATGIALDTARLGIEGALAAARRAEGEDPRSSDHRRPIDSAGTGAVPREHG